MGAEESREAQQERYDEGWDTQNLSADSQNMFPVAAFHLPGLAQWQSDCSPGAELMFREFRSFLPVHRTTYK